MDDHPMEWPVPSIARPFGTSSWCLCDCGQARSANQRSRRLRDVLGVFALLGDGSAFAELPGPLVSFRDLAAGGGDFSFLPGFAVLRQAVRVQLRARPASPGPSRRAFRSCGRATPASSSMFIESRSILAMVPPVILFSLGMIRKKPGPHSDSGVDTGFPWANRRNAFARRSCSNNKLERDDDSS